MTSREEHERATAAAAATPIDDEPAAPAAASSSSVPTYTGVPPPPPPVDPNQLIQMRFRQQEAQQEFMKTMSEHMLRITQTATVPKDDDVKSQSSHRPAFDRDERRDERRTPASLEVPSWDGSSHSFSQYKYDIEHMKHIMAKSDYPSIVGRLIAKLTGPAQTAVNKTQVQIDLYDAPDGYLKFLDWLQQAVGINEHEEENKHF